MAPLKPFYPKSDLFGKAQSSVFRELFKQKLEKISKTKEEKEQGVNTVFYDSEGSVKI